MAPILFAFLAAEACSLTSLDYLTAGDHRDAAGTGGTATHDGPPGGSGGANGVAADGAVADRPQDVASVVDVGNDAGRGGDAKLGTGGLAGSGGVVPTGGVAPTGGMVAAGGVMGSGGLLGTGGVLATGGAVATGGIAAAGGMIASGGVVATGGVRPTGGVIATGGASARGGVSGTGGCPVCSHAITPTGESTTALHGDRGGGTAHKDRCPLDQVVVGYSGTLRDDVYTSGGSPVLQVSSMKAVCGTLSVSEAGQVTVSKQGTLTERGEPGAAGAWSQMCPTNQVIVGVYGRAGVILDQIGFVCAALSSKVSGCSISLEIGKSNALNPAGSSTGGSTFSDQCPAGMIVSGQNLYSEAWIDSYGLLCSTPMPVAACGT